MSKTELMIWLLIAGCGYFLAGGVGVLAFLIVATAIYLFGHGIAHVFKR